MVQLKDGIGVSAARNIGIEKTTSQYLIFLDADDYWLDRHMLENLHAGSILEQADFTSFGFCRIDESAAQRLLDGYSCALPGLRHRHASSIMRARCKRIS